MLYLQAAHSFDLLVWQDPAATPEFAPLRSLLWGGLDLLKLALWLVIPLALWNRRIDPGWLDPRRASRRDLVAILGLAALASAAFAVIPMVPELRKEYPSLVHLAPEAKRSLLGRGILWNLSWLPGWELCYRYLLLDLGERRWPGRGWLLVPLLEGFHHLQKPWPEAIGSVLLSLVLTPWALRRRNLVAPALVHFLLEISLLLFLVMV